MRLQARCAFRLTYTSLLLCLLAVGSVRPQAPGPNQYGLGARVSYGQSTISFRPYQERFLQPAYDAALFFNLSAVSFASMRLELEFSQTSYKTVEYRARPYADSVLLGKTTQGVCQWIRVPLLVTLFYEYKHFIFMAFGGPYGDFLLRERYGLPGKLQNQIISYATYNRLGFGILGGGGIGYKTKIGTFMLELRATYRLVNLYRRPRIPQQDEPKSIVNSQSLGITYLYTFKRTTQKAPR